MSANPIDQETRTEIISSNHKHYLVSASAGSGKTTILIDKAFSLIDKKMLKSYQSIGLITFTRLATRQLNKKIKKKILDGKFNGNQDFYTSKLNVSTTESLIVSEIIKPFLREAYGVEYPLTKDVIQNYNQKFNTFDDGLRILKKTFTLGSYFNSQKNFIYELANEVLRRSKNARLYLKAKYPYIMVDEYQDVDRDMHDLYMYMKTHLGINLFLVGDINQLLYSFRGADKEILESLKKDNDFRHFRLLYNFRSHMSIVKYSYLFIDEETTIEEEYENRVYFHPRENLDLLLKQIETSGAKKEWAYIYARKQIWDATSTNLEDIGFDLVGDPPLTSAYPNYGSLEPLLKKYFKYPNYNTYSVLEELQLALTQTNKKKINTIIDEVYVNPDVALDKLEKLKNIILSDEEKERFKETLHEQYKINFNMSEFKKVALTIHKSKGLEFDNVIVDADSFFNWEGFQKENHYVAITRPKETLHIIMNEQYKSYLDVNRIKFDLTLL